MAVTDHGGPDAGGVPLHDFSTNANACGPCPQALAWVQAADASRYPDPAGTRVKAALAAFHGVDVARVLLLASASEGMQRFSAWAARTPDARVWLPPQHYGDLGRAASTWGLARTDDPAAARLVWACEPSTPLGRPEAGLAARVGALQPGHCLVLDSAYEPLRLSGQATALDRARVWQLFSPNKALGLTGVRAAYALAPEGAEGDVVVLQAMAASWPVGAHGEALLLAWTRPEVQRWVLGSLDTLRTWKARQIERCERLGWQVLTSDTNYFCARLPQAADATQLARLRQGHGVKLRDAASFGLPGHVRVGVLPPAAQDALAYAWAAKMNGET
jgi:histidinol-phosphate aminotransferase